MRLQLLQELMLLRGTVAVWMRQPAPEAEATSCLAGCCRAWPSAPHAELPPGCRPAASADMRAGNGVQTSYGCSTVYL